MPVPNLGQEKKLPQTEVPSYPYTTRDTTEFAYEFARNGSDLIFVENDAGGDCPIRAGLFMIGVEDTAENIQLARHLL